MRLIRFGIAGKTIALCAEDKEKEVAFAANEVPVQRYCLNCFNQAIVVLADRCLISLIVEFLQSLTFLTIVRVHLRHVKRPAWKTL